MVTIDPAHANDFYHAAPPRLTVAQQAECYAKEMEIKSTPFIPTNQDREVLQWISEIQQRAKQGELSEADAELTEKEIF